MWRVLWYILCWAFWVDIGLIITFFLIFKYEENRTMQALRKGGDKHVS